MRWADDGIFLNGRPFGETSVIADIFTKDHGRTLGLVKGGRSRKIRPVLQPGNLLRAEWRARLDEQLGVYTVELLEPVAAATLDSALCLTGVLSVTALCQMLPERDPHPELFSAARKVMEDAGHHGASEQRSALRDNYFARDMVLFELKLLDELGFGLVLTHCAASGQRGRLVYVSPRSAQAVSEDAGAPYRDRLLPLPFFLTEEGANSEPDVNEILAGFSLTGYFLDLHVYGQNAKSLPSARKDFLSVLHAKGKEGPRAEHRSTSA